MKPDLIDRLDAIRDRLHRWRWRIRLVVAVLLLPWVAHYTYTRWTAKPARRSDGPINFCERNLVRARHGADHTDDLAAALMKVPTSPEIPRPTSAPSGMRWVWDSVHGRGEFTSIALEPDDALYGEWTPATRYHLSQIIAYIESPATAKALDEIIAISARPFRIDPDSEQEIQTYDGLWEATNLLVVRARYWLAERGDYDRAARDIRAVLQLVAGVEDGRTANFAWRGDVDRSGALREIRHWARDGTLDNRQYRDLLNCLREHSFSMSDKWEACVNAALDERAYYLDHHYSRTDTDNGWLVVAKCGGTSLPPRLGQAFNLLSVAFNARATVEAEMQSVHNTLVSLRDLPYRDVIEILKTDPPARPADPAYVVGNCIRLCRIAWEDLAETEASHVGTITTLALAMYKTDHGRYPDDLTTLVPEYLATIPIDPFSDAPLRYRLDSPNEYVLYSVGDDGTDDGGFGPHHEYELTGEFKWLDFPLDEPRGDSWDYEWSLVPAENTGGQDDGNDDE